MMREQKHSHFCCSYHNNIIYKVIREQYDHDEGLMIIYSTFKIMSQSLTKIRSDVRTLLLCLGPLSWWA